MAQPPPSITWDLHVHAAPSSSARWGTDLDLVVAAERHGLKGFVLKSHHESTAGRAVIANAFAARIGAPVRAIGGIVLNPWITLVEVDRAIGLGARMIWWPTRDARGRVARLGLPRLHGPVLARAAASGCIVATGHLAIQGAVELVSEASRMGVTAIATHPFNPDVGVGSAGAAQLGAGGAIVEVDAYSIFRLPGGAASIVGEVERLVASGIRVIVSSDGGQAATGDPFAFAQTALLSLQAAGLGDIGALVRTAETLMVPSS
jgi:hypothetical protein